MNEISWEVVKNYMDCCSAKEQTGQKGKYYLPQQGKAWGQNAAPWAEAKGILSTQVCAVQVKKKCL